MSNDTDIEIVDYMYDNLQYGLSQYDSQYDSQYVDPDELLKQDYITKINALYAEYEELIGADWQYELLQYYDEDWAEQVQAKIDTLSEKIAEVDDRIAANNQRIIDSMDRMTDYVELEEQTMEDLDSYNGLVSETKVLMYEQQEQETIYTQLSIADANLRLACKWLSGVLFGFVALYGFGMILTTLGVDWKRNPNKYKRDL